MSDSPEPKPSKGEKLLKPLPRLWKSETDEPEEGSPAVGKDGAAKKASKQGKAAASSPTRKSKSSSGKSKGSKKSVEADEKEGKKVLLEETPTFDTVESRQRVRLIVGAVGVSLIVGLCWITYRVFLYDPGPKVVAGDDPTMTFGQPDALRLARPGSALHVQPGSGGRQERPDGSGNRNVEEGGQDLQGNSDGCGCAARSTGPNRISRSSSIVRPSWPSLRRPDHHQAGLRLQPSSMRLRSTLGPPREKPRWSCLPTHRKRSSLHRRPAAGLPRPRPT